MVVKDNEFQPRAVLHGKILFRKLNVWYEVYYQELEQVYEKGYPFIYVVVYIKLEKTVYWV